MSYVTYFTFADIYGYYFKEIINFYGDLASILHLFKFYKIVKCHLYIFFNFRIM